MNQINGGSWHVYTTRNIPHTDSRVQMYKNVKYFDISESLLEPPAEVQTMQFFKPRLKKNN